jgi:hypothetical protein
VAPGLGHTSTWRRGPKVRTDLSPLLPGLIIATFDGERYGNHTDGRSHAAVLVSFGPGGSLVVLDQWRGQVVHQRVIRPKGGQGLAVNDADQYHVVEQA